MKPNLRLLAITSFIAANTAMPAVVLADQTPALSGAPAPDAAAIPAAPAADAGATSPAATAANAGAPASEGEGPHPGPFMKERVELLMHLRQASAHGIGTANYMMAFKAIEQQVKSGAPEAQVKPRIDSLNNALIDQLKRAQVLKTQRPLPPSASQQPESGGPPHAGGALPPGALSGGGGLGGKQISPEMISKIKEKLGGVDIPEGLKEKLLNSDKAKELLKQFGQ